MEHVQISLAEARHLAAETATGLRRPPIRVPVARTLGSVLATSVEALQSIPHAATSAMDGWAVSGAGPWTLLDGDESALSPATPRPILGPGEAVAVVTGSPIPEGATSVLRSEHARTEDVHASGRRLLADPASGDLATGRHVRAAGSEATAGEPLLRVGELITPARAAMAAVAGHDDLTVWKAPRVSLICTGDEVITTGLPAPGQVRDAFEVSVPGAVNAMGAVMHRTSRVGDDVAALHRALREAVSSDVELILTTGGTARSEADALRPALAELGAEILIDSVDMRPGHPVLLARLDQTLVLGLPGNPLAGFAALVALGTVVLDELRGLPDPAATGLRRHRVRAELTGARRGLRLMPVQTSPDGVGPVGHDNPHMMRGLASAEAFALVPPGGIPAGGAADLLPLPWSTLGWPPGVDVTPDDEMTSERSRSWAD